MAEELFPLVDEGGALIGSVRRSVAHGDPSQIHPVVHCLVTNDRGELLLQLRGPHKDVQPGKWDTSVGGHVVLGESVEQALWRELREEVGLHAAAVELRFLYRYLNRSPIETELVYTYTCRHNGPFVRQASEIDELRFWSLRELEAAVGTGVLTPNFEHELALFRRAR